MVKLYPRLAGLGLILMAAFAGCTTAADMAARSAAVKPALSRRDQLRQALAQADRMTLFASAPEGGTPTVRELRSPAAILDFLDNTEIDEAAGAVRCDCPSDAVFTFHAGDKLLATLSLHRLGYLRWQDGPWSSDAVISPASSQWLQDWSKQAGCDVTAVVRALATHEAQENEIAKRRFVGHFTPAARKIFEHADTVVYNSHFLRRIETPLTEFYPDKAALAEAGLRALGETRQRWLEDDWAVGAVQTALMELDPAVVEAAMDRLQGDEAALLGAARFFFRSGFDAKLPADPRTAWTLRLADLVLRAGRDSNKPALLECLALIPGDATASLLRAIARGERTYAYAPPCNELTLDIEEPGLRATAALLLAKRADPGAREILAALARPQPFGPDQAALEIGAALLDAHAPLKPAHFKYRSRTLGLAALAALERRPGSAIPLDVLAAACAHDQEDVAGRAEKIAQHYQLQRADEGADDDEPALDYDPLLADSYPRLAVEEYSALIPKVSGLTLARLHTLRAQAYASLGDFSAAEADYANVEATPFAEGTDVRTRLAWMQFYLGDFDAAGMTIEKGLQSAPSAELVLLRGIIRYTLGDFSPGTEADLIAARVLDPKEGYAALFEHLVATLGQRAEESPLRSYLASSPNLPDWPRQIIGFMLGYLDAPRLLEIARTGDPAEADWHSCEANFYISQMARTAERSDEERKYLLQCVATNQPNVAEFWAAKYRLEKLRPARPASPARSRPGSAPTI